MKKTAKRQKEAAEALGITPQALGLWMKRPGAPVEGVGRDRRCLWPDFPLWREHEIKAQIRSEAKQADRPANLVEAEQRKAVADAVLAELKVGKEEEALIAVVVHEQVVGEMADRLRAVLVNAPSNYLADLERLGVKPKDGQAVLEKIAEDLTLALRASVDGDPES